MPAVTQVDTDSTCCGAELGKHTATQQHNAARSAGQRCERRPARLQVGVERVAEARGDRQAPQAAQAILEDPVDGRGGRQRALRAHAHRRQQRLRALADGPGVARVGLGMRGAAHTGGARVLRAAPQSACLYARHRGLALSRKLGCASRACSGGAALAARCCRASMKVPMRAQRSTARAGAPARLRGKVLQHGGEQAVHGAPARVAPVVLGHLAARRQERGHRRRLAPAARVSGLHHGPPSAPACSSTLLHRWRSLLRKAPCRTDRHAVHSSRGALIGSEPLPPAARARQARRRSSTAAREQAGAAGKACGMSWLRQLHSPCLASRPTAGTSTTWSSA